MSKCVQNRITSSWQVGALRGAPRAARGKFNDKIGDKIGDKFIDKEAYEAKKDKAIQKLSQSLQVDDVNVWQRKYYNLLAGIDVPTKEVANII